MVGVLGGSVDAPTMAIAAALNAALTPVDLILWQSVFAKIGSKFLSGGRYIRPFVSGTIPFLLMAPFIYTASFWFGSFVYTLVLA